MSNLCPHTDQVLSPPQLPPNPGWPPCSQIPPCANCPKSVCRRSYQLRARLACGWGELLRIEGTSPWYLLPFAVSVAVLVAIPLTWRSHGRGSRGFAVVATVLSAVVVLAIDLFGGRLVFMRTRNMPVRAGPNPAVNTDAHRRGFARAVVAGYLTR